MIEAEIEQALMSYLNEALKEKEGFEMNPRIPVEIKRNVKSFKSLMDNCGYTMDYHFAEDESFVIQFSSADGNLYTTYGFNSVFVPSKK